MLGSMEFGAVFGFSNLFTQSLKVKECLGVNRVNINRKMSKTSPYLIEIPIRGGRGVGGEGERT